jgi:cyclohexanone monooxygenase
MHVHGFPNCFLMSNAQAGFTANFPHLSNEQAKHLAYIIRHGLDANAAQIEVSAEAEQAWIEQCLQKARQTGDFFENCTPGYYNNEGKPGERSAQDGFYGGGSPEFFRILDAWRAEGKLAGLVVS